MTDTLPPPPYPMDLITELTPYTLTNDEAQAARTAFNWALRTRFTDMHAAMCDLPLKALLDVLLAVDILGSVLRFEVDGRRFDQSLTPQEHKATSVDGSDRTPIPADVDGWPIEGRST